MSETKHPDGSVQGICSAAIGLFALLIAFIGYTGFSSTSGGAPWQRWDLLHLVPSCIAGLSLASVPWLATKRRPINEVGKSIDTARMFFALGAFLTLVGIISFLLRDFIRNHV
jgi:hypothetical protein